MKQLTIIDTFGFFFRSYFALPPLKTSEGFPTGLLTGFVNLIDSLKKEHETDYILFALDAKGKTFRSDLYSEYKENRQPPPDDLLKQLPIAIEWIEKMGFANLSEEGFEADDIITTVTRLAKEQGVGVRIVSHDKDLYQLIDDGKVVMYDPSKKQEITETECMEKYGVKPEDFINFQAIVGDSSDNIPGVKGIGVKGASKLINEFKTLENIYDNLEDAGTPRIQKLLDEAKENAYLSRELVTLRDDVYDSIDLEKFLFGEEEYLLKLTDEFVKYEMRQALGKIGRGDKKIEPKRKEPTVRFDPVTLSTKEELFAILDHLTDDTIVAFDTETTGLDTKVESMVGFSFCFDEGKAYYVPVAHNYLGVGDQVNLEDAKAAIRKLFQSRIVGQNLKFDLSLLYHQLGLSQLPVHADTMLMAWISQPGSKVGLDFLAKKYFRYDMKPFKEMVKRGQNFSHVQIEDATFYAAEDAWMTRMIYFSLKKHLEFQSMEKVWELLADIEYPFIETLLTMERIGIKVDTQRLEVLKEDLSTKLALLTEEIYALTDTQFNIKSTQQLGEVLFGKLCLKGGKKTKTGYSTNEQVLNDLIDEHPVIKKILEYREYQKILSTYAVPLIGYAQKDEDHRIYTSFLQTGTATGRLSSKDPNLQNIPVRSEIGRSVREAFIAREGYKLVSIDYSQIELRLLAHFSGDKALSEAFVQGKDIHMATAQKLFGEEAEQKRSIAKSINFGLLYGMGSKKLANEIHVSTTEAKEIIASYFASFSTVKVYLESIQEHMKTNGYVETLLKRRRFFDYEGANGMQKAGFLRESVNTVFQGSAADLIKLSMNKIHKEIEDKNLEAFMLLQIHDELIFEVREDKITQLSEKFKTIMETIYTLDIPLECSVSIGDNWGELK
jgi:DNA polymerase-1